MFQRFRLLSASAVLCGGLICWSLLSQPSSGQNPGGKESSGTTLQAPASAHPETHSIPAPPPRRAEGDFDLYEPDKTEEKIHQALRNPKGVDLEFIETPIKDAMEHIGDAYDITIIIDEQALTEEGVAVDQPINKILSGIKLESALKIMFEPLGLTYVVEDEVLKITTIIAADEKRKTRVYNTGYLRQVGVEPESLSQTIQHIVEPNTWRRNSTPRQAMTGPAKEIVVQNNQNPATGPKAQTDSSVFHFQGAVLSTVQHGGNPGGGGKPLAKTHEPKNSIQVLGDMLVVSAPESVHRKVRDLLIQIDRRWETQQAKK